MDTDSADPDRWHAIDELFRRALELPAPQRAPFLDGACGGDEELRREVEGLLDSVHEADRYFEELAQESEIPAPSVRRALRHELETASGTEARGGIGPPSSRSEETERLVATLRDGLVGRFDVEGIVGEGGTAIVVRGRDARSGDDVAIKALRPDIVAFASVDRFLREIGVLATLRHPRILPVLASDEIGGLPYYVMPLVREGSLRQRLKRDGRLALDTAVRITREVAEGLSYAHEQGLIHRDIKPENILLSERGAVLVDFGIARAIDRSAGERLTATGLTLGTPSYMSPEQLRGDEHLDGRTDQYALACVVVEMLLGERPFTGPSPQVIIARHLRTPPPSIRILDPSVPRAVDDAIQRAMSKEPASRFSSVQGFADTLQVAATGRADPGQAEEAPATWPARIRERLARWRSERGRG